MKLSDMPNIGKTLERQLINSDITSPEALVELGSVEAIRRLGLSGPTCYNKLYALEGAIRGIRWHDISKEDREALKRELG